MGQHPTIKATCGKCGRRFVYPWRYFAGLPRNVAREREAEAMFNPLCPKCRKAAALTAAEAE